METKNYVYPTTCSSRKLAKALRPVSKQLNDELRNALLEMLKHAIKLRKERIRMMFEAYLL